MHGVLISCYFVGVIPTSQADKLYRVKTSYLLP